MEDLKFMAAIIAGGLMANHSAGPETIANKSIELAQVINRKCEAIEECRAKEYSRDPAAADLNVDAAGKSAPQELAAMQAPAAAEA